jgi:hypothetical protein
VLGGAGDLGEVGVQAPGHSGSVTTS